jgi:hypothetical protein
MWGKLSKKKKALLIFIGFIVIAWFLTPFLVKNYINYNSRDIFGRKASISSLGFNYFTGSINAEDFIIYDENDTDTLFFTSKAHTNLNFYAYLKGDYVFEKIDIDGLKLNLVLNDTVLNFSGLINHLFNSGEDGKSGQLKFENISIKNSSVSYKDKLINSYACAKNLNIQTLKEFSANELILNVKTDFELESGGEVNSEFIYDFKNTEYDIVFNSNKLDLAVLHPYLADLTYSKGSGGKYNSNIKASGFINSPIQTSLLGTFSLKDVFLNDSTNIEIASFKDLSVGIDSINLAREFFDLKKIKFDKPFAKLTIDKDSDNFNRLIKHDSVAESENSYSNIFIVAGKYISAFINQIKVTNFSVDSLNITDVNIDFTDNKLLKPFEYNLFHGTLTSNTLKSNNDSIHVDFNADLKNKGRLSLTGIFNSNDPDNIEGNIKLFDVIARDFSPYSYEYFGLPILQGKAFLNSQLSITNQQLKNNNRIRFFNLEFGEKERNPEIYRLPIKTAAQALKDKDGETLLNFNITGDLSDPNYNILNVIGQVLKELILNAAISR